MDIPMRRASSKITLVSPTLENNMKLCAKGKVVTISNGVELPPVKPKPTEGDIHCIAIGRIEKEKGIHFAIRAVADLTEAERGSVALNIVGEGAYLDTLKQLSDDLGVNDSVVFHGRCDDKTLSDIYNSSRIHLMPTTRQEGLPLTILEGMAFGLATLASDIGGISGVITNEVDGILIQPGNQQQLSLQLSKLLADRNRINEIGQAARSTIVSKYTKEHMVNSTLEVLSGVAIKE